MKASTIIKALLGAGLLVSIGFEIGLFQRVFDSRSVVKDGVVGADFWILEVDGEPTERIQHGLLITKVPSALIQPGERVMKLSEESRPSEDEEPFEYHATIQKGVNYRILKNEEGNPELIVEK